VPAVGETFDHYRLESVLARPGSLTEAFRATDLHGDLEVAVEILKAGATSVEKARFGTRARRLASVRHPALRTLLDSGTTHCAYEAPAGTPLGEHAGVAIARYRQKLFWLAQIAGALAALHKAGIGHGALTIDEVTVLVDGAPKVAIPLGPDLTGSPLDDVRAFGALACDLILGLDSLGDEAAIKAQLMEAGVPEEPAALLARLRGGGSATMADLSEKLAAYSDYAGPTTEPLLPVARP
jgi:hypothetical protein